MEIELLGHKAEVDVISWRPAYEPWHKDDEITVWLKLDESVEATSGFGISLPLQDYTEEEFKAEVKKVGEERLRYLIEKHQAEAAEHKKKEKKRKSMNKTVADLGDKLGVEYIIRER